jgi:hypothetical protein
LADRATCWWVRPPHDRLIGTSGWQYADVEPLLYPDVHERELRSLHDGSAREMNKHSG